MQITKSLLLIAAALLLRVNTAESQVLRYGTASWNADTLGNHRAVVRVGKAADAVLARIDWRRRDHHPEDREVIVVEAATGRRIRNVLRVNINREFGELLFQAPYAGTYHFYYLPYAMTKGNYPKTSYNPPQNLAEASWTSKYKPDQGRMTSKELSRYPMVTASEIQSVDEFNSFFPMEVIASGDEIASLMKADPAAPFLIFPESRKYSIRMSDDIPQRWALKGAGKALSDTVSKGEYYTFQLGFWAVADSFNQVRLGFSDLKNAGNTIGASNFTCFNTGGVNSDAEDFSKDCAVPKGKVQAFWCGLQIPPDAIPGVYTAEVSVTAGNEKPRTFSLLLRVTGPVLDDGGVDDPTNLSRLKWLNSRLAMDDGIVPPYTPMTLDNRTIGAAGQEDQPGRTGFPRFRSKFLRHRNDRDG